MNTMLQPVVQNLQQSLQQQQKQQAQTASSQPPTQMLAMFDRLTVILR